MNSSRSSVLTRPRLSLPDTRPVIGILRGFSEEQVVRIVRAAKAGGLRYLEITMNTPGAEAQIRAAVTAAGGAIQIGAGTVTDLALLDRAHQAGATFIVTPIVDVNLIQTCLDRGLPVFPGALSPTEIATAWEAGATMVKVFPSESTGPGYLRALRGPFPQVRLLPTGGVNLETIGDYLRAGADGFGVGSPLFPKDRVDAGDDTWIENRCRAFVQAVRDAGCDPNAGMRDERLRA